MRRSTRIDGSAGGEPLSCGNQSTYNRVANAGNLHRLSPFQMPFGILHNLTGKSSLTFSIEKCHFITAICSARFQPLKPCWKKTCRHLPLLCMAKIGNRLTTSATPLNRWVFLPRIISCLIVQKTKLAGERLPLVQ